MRNRPIIYSRFHSIVALLSEKFHWGCDLSTGVWLRSWNVRLWGIVPATRLVLALCFWFEVIASIGSWVFLLLFFFAMKVGTIFWNPRKFQMWSSSPDFLPLEVLTRKKLGEVYELHMKRRFWANGVNRGLMSDGSEKVRAHQFGPGAKHPYLVFFKLKHLRTIIILSITVYICVGYCLTQTIVNLKQHVKKIVKRWSLCPQNFQRKEPATRTKAWRCWFVARPSKRLRSSGGWAAEKRWEVSDGKRCSFLIKLWDEHGWKYDDILKSVWLIDPGCFMSFNLRCFKMLRESAKRQGRQQKAVHIWVG